MQIDESKITYGWKKISSRIEIYFQPYINLFLPGKKFSSNRM